MTQSHEKQPRIDASLKQKYEDDYSRTDLGAWRRVCAVEKVSHILDLCDESYSDVVDVGAGEGSVLARLAEVRFAPNLFALEISERGAAQIRSRNIDALRQVQVFDGYTAPYPDMRFDLAIASHVLEHVEHERLFLAELSRIGKNVLIEVPLENNLRVHRHVANKMGHINFYCRETILALLGSAGLRPLRWKVYDRSIEVSAFHEGFAKGATKHLIRSSLLRLAPSVAEHLFTYHMAILAAA